MIIYTVIKNRSEVIPKKTVLAEVQVYLMPYEFDYFFNGHESG